MKKANKIQIEITFKGEGLVNYNGNNVPYRFLKEMTPKGKVTKNGSFGKENSYKVTKTNKDGEQEIEYVNKKITSGGLLKKMIIGDENDINADKLCLNDKLRVSYISQDNVIARGYVVLKKDEINIKRKSAFMVSDAEQIPIIKYNEKIETITSLKIKTAEGSRDNTSLFFKETCGEIEFKSKIFVDIRQLQFVSIDENYDRASMLQRDIDEYIRKIENRYGKDSAKNGNWATSNKNLIGEEGIVLSSKVVSNVIRESIIKMISFEIMRSNSFLKTKSIKISIGHQGESIDLLSNPKFVEINNIDEYDKLVEKIEFGVEFLAIKSPMVEKTEKIEVEKKKKVSNEKKSRDVEKVVEKKKKVSNEKKSRDVEKVVELS